MRNIKFRAWDSMDKKIIKDISELQHTIYIRNNDGFGDTERQSFDYKNMFNGHLRNRYKLMQYTGLKDKNGVEIYEGDIIKFITEDDNYIIDFNNELLNYSIYSMRKKFLMDLYECNVETYEVIGNIYENKELLE